MIRNGLLAIEVVVLVLLMQTNHFLKQKFSSNVNQKQSNHCSRSRSLVVRTVLIQKFYPIIDKFNISLPIDCPFHPLRELDTNLDRNLVVDDSICLADYCDIIRCDVLIGSEKRKHLSSLKSSSSLNSDSECDKEKLKNLYEKCTNLIRQCTLGSFLELDSSMKEFMKLERELSKSICSFFLNCDLYCQNNLDRTRNISIKFLIFLILLMICLFSICYYFVWNLLENDNSYYNELQLSTRIKNVFKVVNLANLVKLVYLVNLCKNKWLCKTINRIDENKENNQINYEEQSEKIDLKEDELIDQQTKLPFKMKQSIFSIRSSSSDSIKKMQLEHLKNLELHEKRIKELEKLNDKKLSEQEIIEEEQFGDLEKKDDTVSDDELDKEVYKHLSGRRFTKDGEIISTKSDDKESFYEEAENEFRKSSNINNELLLVNDRKDQRRLSEQSICSNLTCPNRLTTNSPSIKNLSIHNQRLQRTLESIKDETKINKIIENKTLDNGIKKQDNIQKNEIQNDKDNDQSNTPRKRLWNITSDITLDSAKLKLLEAKRIASRQLNYKIDGNNQSDQLCKDLKRKSDIELKEFHHLSTKTSTKRIEQNNLKSTYLINQNLSNQNLSNQFIDQSKESNRRFLYRQSLSNSRSNSVQKYASCGNNNFMIMNSKEDVVQPPPPITKKLINPILNQIIFQKTRSQPGSLSQTPILPSTSSTPYR